MEQTELLNRVVQLIDDENIPYCILHGYTEFADKIDTDVDILVSTDEHVFRITDSILTSGMQVIQFTTQSTGSHYFTVTSTSSSDRPPFLHLDLVTNIRFGKNPGYSALQILSQRRRWKQFWVPSAKHEFSAYLIRRISKGVLSTTQTSRLSELYAADPNGCEAEIRHLWSSDAAELLIGSARGGDWTTVIASLSKLQREIARHDRPALRKVRRVFDALYKLARRLREHTGLFIVFLGPDGVGKTTTIHSVKRSFTGPFASVSVHHFSPGILRVNRQLGHTRAVSPHGKRLRSPIASLMKSAYWWLDFTGGYVFGILPDLLRTRMIIYDRYLIDVLVDPKRYRYGGPRLMIAFIWKITPKPDLCIMLDASSEIIHTRKQEVPIEETARQLREYRSIVSDLPYGHIVDASQESASVAADVNQIIIAYLSEKVRERLEKPQRS